MKKKIIIGSVVLGMAFFVSIAGLYLYYKNINYKITITEKFWNEYGEQYHNKTSSMSIKLNDEIKVDGALGDELIFKVIRVNKNSITLKTSEKMSREIVNLLSQDDEFIIKKDEEIKLNRLVTDMGISYTIIIE